MRVCPQCERVYSEGEAFCPYDGARLREHEGTTVGQDPLVGQLLDGRYRLQTVLGRGGAGTVYRAELEKLGRPVAIKVLRSTDDVDEGDALARFEREARAASKLGERHIVRVYDFGRTDTGLAFLVMELLDGADLADALSRKGRFGIEQASTIILQCCQGLGAAHGAGIVHRDLKPENIVLAKGEDGTKIVKLVDFGLAKMSDMEQGGEPGRKLTTTGMIFGTPQYMSPEQCLGKDIDQRADIYGLGCIFYELLTGRVPFEGDSFLGVLNQHICDPPPPFADQAPHAQVPAPLEALVMRCLAKDPAERPASMAHFQEDLLQALHASGAQALSAQLRASAPASHLAFADLTSRQGGPIDPLAPTGPSQMETDETIHAERRAFEMDGRAPTVEAPFEVQGVPTFNAPVSSVGETGRVPRVLPPEGPPVVSGGSGIGLVLAGLALLALGGLLAYLAITFG